MTTRPPIDEIREAKTVDWVTVRSRLADAIRATDAALTPSAEHAKRILDERALALARPIDQPSSADEAMEVLIFTLGDEKYAVEASYVRFVARMDEFTAIPGTSATAIGVINLRGEILPIFDLRTIVGIPVRGLTDLSRLVVCGDGSASFSFLADEVHEVTTISAADMHELPDSVMELDLVSVRGITADAVILLDGAALVADRRLFVDGAETCDINAINK